MRLKLLIAASTAVVSALATAAMGAAPAAADHAWGPYHWARTANPFTLALGDNVDATWDSYLRAASADWTKSSVLDTTVVAGGTKPRSCKTTAGRVEVCNAKYGNTGWLGIASISITGGQHITASYVKLNDTYFSQPQYNTPEWRLFVMCQEVGHAFGLDHQDEDFDNANLGTCMDYTSNPATNQHPNAHDYEQLEAIYAHLDSTTTVGSTSAAVPQVGNDAASWGTKVDGSAASGHSTYVRDFGRGNLVVTFVTWA